MSRLRDFEPLEDVNFAEHDLGLKTILSDLLSSSDREPVFASLSEWGQKTGGEWNALASDAGRQENLPRIFKYDRTGAPVERIDFCAATRQLRREIAELGVLTHTRNDLHRFAIIYLLAHNGEASVNCGLSCTDGLIRALEARGSEFLRDTYVPLLKSTETPLAGAQFVTEQDGGSDVGAIETEAIPNSDGSWSLTGEKWFCSNPDEYFLVAARPRGARPGTAGLGVFMVPRVLLDGRVNAISFRRLKNKLGTQSLPTAEIDFNGATGWAIGPVEEGFKTLMNYVINVSRIHNAANACGFLRRAFLEARNYSRQRETFGRALITNPVIRETLIGLLEKLWRYRLLTFKTIASVDSNGLVPSSSGDAMWQRFLINLGKYRTAVTLTPSIREAILILGGNGIVEDFSVLPRLLRDSMIIETWEGPHNTLCLQILRDAAKSDLIERWHAEVASGLEKWPGDFLPISRSRVSDAFEAFIPMVSASKLQDHSWTSMHLRRLVDRMADLLEIVWMSDLARRTATADSTAAVLTAAAVLSTIGGEFDDALRARIASHSIALVDEEPFRADLEGF